VCGVVAAVRAGGGLELGELDAPLAAIGHRGPDGVGRYRSPGGRALLGHARLAIVDLTGGAQPIAVDGGAVQVAVTGEFYGHREIAAGLRARGRHLTTRSDSEIAGHLYVLQGARALDRLRGEFAVVIWDEARGELFAARDRFGIKPLYYAERAGTLLIASEIKALLAAGVAARWDLEAMADHLQIALPPGRSLFAGVHQLPPGCLLRAGRDGVRVERYWEPDYPPAGAAPPCRSLAGHVERVRAEVVDAVQVRAVADVPVGYHLSGGLDSSSVAAVVASTGPPPATFTVRFDEPALDEGPAARRAAAGFGGVHHEIPVGRDAVAETMAATVRAAEIVPENSHGVARYLLAAAVRDAGFRAVQAGEGGDEVFLGYPQARRDLELSCSPQAWARAVDGYARLGPAATSPTVGTLLGVLGALPSWILERQMTVTGPVRRLLRPDFAAFLDGRDSAAPLLAAAAGQLDGRSFLHRSQYLFLRTWMVNYILAAERLDMAHGVEVRLPLLDHRLFEAVRDTPPRWYAVDGQGKYPLRQAMRALLPPDVLGRAKQPFHAPPAATDESAFTALRALADGQALRDNPFFDPARVRAELDRLAGLPAPARAPSEQLLQIVAGTCALTAAFAMTSG
jgi:asparagine synthase (glutamine-hydrolysing)